MVKLLIITAFLFAYEYFGYAIAMYYFDDDLKDRGAAHNHIYSMNLFFRRGAETPLYFL